MTRKIGDQKVYGLQLNAHGACTHYHSDLDIIATRFKCCQRYFACYFCHEELAGHSAEKWALADFDLEAILCGCCGYQLTIFEYGLCGFSCPDCRAPFNPKCQEHWNLYFSHYLPNCKG